MGLGCSQCVEGSNPFPWEKTLIGRVLIGPDRLKVVTNSVRRADALRAKVQAGLGLLVRHRLRDHADIEPMIVAAAKRPPIAKEEPPPELKALLRDFKEQHMTQWLEDQIPALDGLAPREAMKKPGSRGKLDVLLRDMENREARLPAHEQFDFSKLRAELGL